MSAAKRPPWSEFRQALEAAGFHPSRRLGQNFLLDEAMVAAIVRDARVEPGERVLEVGVGCGFLSAHLLDAGVRLLGVEIDRRLFDVARRFLEPLAEAHPRASLELLSTDVLASKNTLAPELLEALGEEEPFHLVSNLPYSVGSPVLALLARRPEPPRSMTALVQTEVAERIAAAPGEPAWGPLGARLALTYEARLVRRVPPGLFWPQPKVDSAVVRLERRKAVPEQDLAAAYDSLVGGLFRSRRKGLRAALKGLVEGGEAADACLASVGLDPARRAETLQVAELLSLSEAMRASGA